MGKRKVNSGRKKSAALKARPVSKEQDKVFLIVVISAAAILVLLSFLMFSGRLVGKAIEASNTANAVLASAAYEKQPFVLKVMAYPDQEITSLKFSLNLPEELSCNDVSKIEGQIKGWAEFENQCDSEDDKIIFFSAKGPSVPSGEKGAITVALIDIDGVLDAGKYELGFGLLAWKDGEPVTLGIPEKVEIEILKKPATAVCGNGDKEEGEACDKGKDGETACTADYGESCTYCTKECQLKEVKGGYCGDLVKNGEEQCDGTPNCDNQCKAVLTATCGDNFCDVKQESTASCSLDCGNVCPTNDLLFWWKGEGDGKGDSKSGFDSDSAFIAAVPGIVGKASRFDGDNSNILFTKKSQKNIAGTVLAEPNHSLSLSFWMKTEALKSSQGGAMYIIDTGAGTDGRRGFYCNTYQGDLNCALRQEGSIYQVSAGKAVPLNSWKLVTLTFDDEKKELALYLDGSFSKKGAETKISSSTYASEQAVIGAANTKQLFFKGLLDEIAVWSRALDPAEVSSLFGSGTTGMCAKPAGECGNGFLEAGEECDDGNKIDGDKCSSLCQKESAFCGDNVCEIKFESTISCQQDCGLVCPTNGLVSWWKGEDEADKTRQDSFGGHDGILGGDAGSIPGKVNDALYFGGEGDYLTLGQKPGTIFSDPTGSDLSVSFWMRANATESPEGALYIFDTGAGAASRRGFYCNTQKGTLNCVIKHAEKIYQVTAEKAVVLNEWKFVAFTFDEEKEELKLFLDGSLAASGTKESLSSAYQPVPASVIGATSLYSLSFNGTIDELAVWDRVLAPAEIKSIFDTEEIGMCAVPETVCGNGLKEEGEECDDGNQLSADSCTSECKIAVCGDGFVQSGKEQCDGNDLAGKSCSDAGNFVNGTLSCSSGCKFDTSACLAAPLVPPATASTVNGTKIVLGEITPANDTFSTLLTAAESFSKDLLVYTLLYDADGKVLKLEEDKVQGGMEKEEFYVVAADYSLDKVKKKSVLVFDRMPDPAIYGKLEEDYS